MCQVLKRITGTRWAQVVKVQKKRSSSLNKWQAKVLWGIFYLASQSPLLLCIPASCLIPLASFFSLPRFSLSPYPRDLCVFVVMFPLLSAFVRLSSRRSLRELCGELSLFYTATIKKQGKGFDMKPKKCSWTQICADISKT